MRNRAKCKLCKSIIESFHPDDYVECKCGEIVVDGGSALRCASKSWDNFLRIDDNNNEVIVKVNDLTKSESADMETHPKHEESPTNRREMVLKLLDNMIENIEKLPQHAMSNPVNHYDLLSALLLISSIFKSDCRADN